MQEALPAHHRKRIARLLKTALADLERRGIDCSGKMALEIFCLRAAERQKDRRQSIAAKAERASGIAQSRSLSRWARRKLRQG